MIYPKRSCDRIGTLLLSAEVVRQAETSEGNTVVSFKLADVDDRDYAALVTLLYDQPEEDSAYIAKSYSWLVAFARSFVAIGKDFLKLFHCPARPADDWTQVDAPESAQISTPYLLLSLAVQLENSGDIKQAANVLRLIIGHPSATTFVKKASGIRLSRLILQLDKRSLSEKVLSYFTMEV